MSIGQNDQQGTEKSSTFAADFKKKEIKNALRLQKYATLTKIPKTI